MNNPLHHEEIVERNKRIVRAIVDNPDKTYVEIGAMYGVTAYTVSKVAIQYSVARTRGAKPAEIRERPKLTAAECKRAARCALCKILIGELDEGVAEVRAKKGLILVCQDCVERYHPRYVVRWCVDPVSRTNKWRY